MESQDVRVTAEMQQLEGTDRRLAVHLNWCGICSSLHPCTRHIRRPLGDGECLSASINPNYDDKSRNVDERERVINFTTGLFLKCKTATDIVCPALEAFLFLSVSFVWNLRVPSVDGLVCERGSVCEGVASFFHYICFTVVNGLVGQKRRSGSQ